MAMADELGSISERVQVVEQKLDVLIASVRSGSDGVDEAFADQRLHTELAFDSLEVKVDSGFTRLDSKIEAGFAHVDARFARLERKIDQVIDRHLPKGPPDPAEDG